ncbi:MAG: hypothetical protein ACREJF_08560 [Candidatus Methylomirabilales bacterium]
MPYDGTQLVRAIRRLGAVPDSGSTGSRDADVLAVATDVQRTHLVPKIMNLREDYFILRERTALGAASRYRVPSKAAFNKLKDVWLVDGNGDRSRLGVLSQEDLDAHNGPGGPSPAGYFLEGNDVQLVPTTGPYTGSLEFVFYARPGSLVLPAAARQVVAVNTGTKTVTLASTVPTAWDDTDTFDAHSPLSGAEYKAWGLTASTVSGDTITFDQEIDGTVYGTKVLEIGDWIVLEGDAALPHLPDELQPMLARAVAAQYAEGQGDMQAAQLHTQVLEKYFGETAKAMEVRVEDKPMRPGAQGRGMLRHVRRWYW